MSFSNYLTEEATIKRLGSAAKVKRSRSVGDTVLVAEPQVKNEMDLVAGMHMEYYYTYASYAEDVRKGDHLVINEEEYDVLTVMPHQVKNIKYKQIKMVRD